MTDLTQMDNAALAAHVAATWKEYRVAHAQHDLACAEHGYGSEEARTTKAKADSLMFPWSGAQGELKRRAREFLVEKGFGVDAELLARVIQ